MYVIARFFLQIFIKIFDGRFKYDTKRKLIKLFSCFNKLVLYYFEIKLPSALKKELHLT